MSCSSSPLAEGSDPLIPPPYGHEDGDTDGAVYARNGSVVSKLFGKSRSQVAVDEISVQSHLNGQEDDNEGELDEDDDEHDTQVNGNGHADAGDEDDVDDDEYTPDSSDEASGQSDDDADVGDLDDEETSMRNLLLPMASYAKQLLFLSEEDDDGEFDDQDAELWSSPQEKREWIDRYEAVNRAYIDKYGCRIDAPAIPDTKKRLRHERNREARYSLVLLALAVAYLIRLLVGPTIPSSIGSAAPIDSSSTPSHIVELPVNTHTPQVPPEWSSRTLLQPLESTEGAVEQLAASSSEELIAKREVVVTEASISATDDSPGGSTPDLGPGQPADDVEDQDSGSNVGENAPPVQGSENPDSFDAPTSISTELVTGKIELDVANVVVPLLESEYGADSNEVRHEVLNVEEPTRHTEVDLREKTADDSFERCLDMFYMLVKMKHDAGVKTAAVSECDRAVEAVIHLATIKRIRAHLLRGDMKSLLQLFPAANQDYEAALSEAIESTMVRSEIEIKIASNRWIEYYHTKQFRELRNDCQRVRDTAPTASTSGNPDRVRELAAEWLRAFRKETTVLEVLTKTRAWTLYRPVTSQTKNS